MTGPEDEIVDLAEPSVDDADQTLPPFLDEGALTSASDEITALLME